MTSARSRFYDSRLSRPGVGYPSCNTELCRLPRNTADPHGYYSEIGVPPWATAEEIKTAARRLYRRLHPDTGARPDPDRLQRVKLIAEVLLDPVERDKYDRTPPGKRLLDRVYQAELSALDLSGLTAEQIDATLRPVGPTEPAPAPGGRWFDYLAVDHRPGDAVRAHNWYVALVAAAPVVGYRRRIKVLLHDGPAFYHPDTAVMAVPRSWWPTTALAFALYTAVAGMIPGQCHRRGVA